MDDGALRTDCDPRGLGLLVYQKERLGNCQLRIVFKSKEWFEPKREPKRPVAGYIGLQNHDPGDVVWFKEVSVRPLPPVTGQ